LKDDECDSDDDFRVVGFDAGFGVNCDLGVHGDWDLSVVGFGDVVDQDVGERREGLSVAEVALGELELG